MMFVGMFGGLAGQFTDMKSPAFLSSCFFSLPVAQEQVLFRDSSRLLGELHRQLFFSALIVV